MSQLRRMSSPFLLNDPGEIDRGPQGNRLLGALPPDVLQRWRSVLKPVRLSVGQVLPTDQAFFPTTATVSLLSSTGSGESAEAATVGNEGVVGIGLVMGDMTSFSQAEVTTAGDALAFAGTTLRYEFVNSECIRSLILSYIQALMMQTVQTTLCVQYHCVLQRLSRSLLDSLDRQPVSSTLEQTQQMLAERLGVRRETVTAAALQLQRRGIVAYKRGVITVHDREALHACSCVCYEVVRSAYDHLLPAADSPHPRQPTATITRLRTWQRPGLGFAALIAGGRAEVQVAQ
jgi:CRP-like cAMP-binding protein